MINRPELQKYDDNLAKITASMLDEIGKVLRQEFNILGGNIVPDLQRLTTVFQDVERIITENPEYFNVTEKLLNEGQAELTERLKLLSKQFPNKKLGDLTFEKLKTITDLQVQTFAQVPQQTLFAIKDIIQLNVVQGANYDTLVEAIRKQLDDKLKRYATTYMSTAKNQFTQEMEYTLAEQINFSDNYYWEYFGDPLVENSHPECIWALTQKENAPYFTEEERQAFEAGTIPGHNPIRYNCHHNFRMTTKEIK